MDKLLLFMLLSAFFMLLHGLQTDEELAMHALFQGKHAVNRAAHASAQQLDPAKLARGIRSIDTVRARSAAMQYLRSNLRLDEGNSPMPGTFWKTRVEVLALDIVNEDNNFPYLYERLDYGYSVTLHRPGVVMIVRLDYPRIYQVLSPISWTIKGAAELVY
jgi:hypothetical protein